jgi:hypothetical protein
MSFFVFPGSCHYFMNRNRHFLLFFLAIMSTILKAISFRSYGAGLLSSAVCISHNLSSSTTRVSCDGAENPLSAKKSTPKFAEIKTEHILPAVKKDLAALKKDFTGD